MDEDSEEPVFIRQYSIVKNIFQFLPTKDLLSATQTNKFWCDVGKIVQKGRLKYNSGYFLLHHPFPDDTQHVMNCCLKNANYDYEPEPRKGHEDPNYDPVQEYLQLDPKENQSLRHEFNTLRLKKLNETFQHPQAVIVFGTDGIFQDLDQEDSGISLDEAIGINDEVLRIPTIGTCGFGLVATTNDETKTYEAEDNYDNSFPILNSLSIPKLPGLKLKIFQNKNDARPYSINKNEKIDYQKVLNIDKDDTVKGIIFFDTSLHTNNSHIKALYSYLRANPNVSMAGGKMNNFISNHTDCEIESSQLVSGGFLICGDERVKVASMAIYAKKKVEKMEENLIKVKKLLGNIEEEISFAVMFACNGRGFAIHREPHFESKLFKKHFPTTKLIGSFTGGEYVHEYVSTSVKPATAPNKQSALLHSYTTTFIIVSVSL